ncbi:hypothetical protein OH76DRAFT_310458 [Lentinus brumalis]|uniref:Uncharacterized protein n=1 Tax=Lentinus brumalis TaxID=2498619 RepID=A0A371CK86_9APHY|nr:hypothetical protein OH76DRAFT_310458 [Polyporus brumalis]
MRKRDSSHLSFAPRLLRKLPDLRRHLMVWYTVALCVSDSAHHFIHLLDTKHENRPTGSGSGSAEQPYEVSSGSEAEPEEEPTAHQQSHRYSYSYSGMKSEHRRTKLYPSPPPESEKPKPKPQPRRARRVPGAPVSLDPPTNLSPHQQNLWKVAQLHSDKHISWQASVLSVLKDFPHPDEQRRFRAPDSEAMTAVRTYRQLSLTRILQLSTARNGRRCV